MYINYTYIHVYVQVCICVCKIGTYVCIYVPVHAYIRCTLSNVWLCVYITCIHVRTLALGCREITLGACTRWRVYVGTCSATAFPCTCFQFIGF